MTTLIIRIPLQVQHLHALAGYYTDGPSMSALYGLVSQLEYDSGIDVLSFGMVLDHYESQCNQWVSTGADVLKDGIRTLGGYRYADMSAALYLETPNYSAEDTDELLRGLVRSINTCRVQGGNLLGCVTADKNDPAGIRIKSVSSPQDLVTFIAANERSIAAAYLSKHLPEALAGEALLEAYAQALIHKDHLMVCNGYVQVTTIESAQGNLLNIVEPTYTLVEAMPIYKLARLTNEELTVALQRFRWAFDVEGYLTTKTHFSII